MHLSFRNELKPFCVTNPSLRNIFYLCHFCLSFLTPHLMGCHCSFAVHAQVPLTPRMVFLRLSSCSPRGLKSGPGSRSWMYVRIVWMARLLSGLVHGCCDRPKGLGQLNPIRMYRCVRQLLHHPRPPHLGQRGDLLHTGIGHVPGRAGHCLMLRIAMVPPHTFPSPHLFLPTPLPPHTSPFSLLSLPTYFTPSPPAERLGQRGPLDASPEELAEVRDVGLWSVGQRSVRDEGRHPD